MGLEWFTNDAGLLQVRRCDPDCGVWWHGEVETTNDLADLTDEQLARLNADMADWQTPQPLIVTPL